MAPVTHDRRPRGAGPPGRAGPRAPAGAHARRAGLGRSGRRGGGRARRLARGPLPVLGGDRRRARRPGHRGGRGPDRGPPRPGRRPGADRGDPVHRPLPHRGAGAARLPAGALLPGLDPGALGRGRRRRRPRSPRRRRTATWVGPLLALLPGRAHPVGVAAGGAPLHGAGGGQRALARARGRAARWAWRSPRPRGAWPGSPAPACCPRPGGAGSRGRWCGRASPGRPSRGCDLAASATEPGTASQRTLERCGFRVAYPKAVLVH